MVGFYTMIFRNLRSAVIYIVTEFSVAVFV